jgi:hypothetical protein
LRITPTVFPLGDTKVFASRLSLAVSSTTVHIEPVSGSRLRNGAIDEASSVGLVSSRGGFDLDRGLVVDLQDAFTAAGLGLVA